MTLAAEGDDDHRQHQQNEMPKESWPIENANERVFGEFDGDSADMAVQVVLLTAPIYDVFRPRGNLPGGADRG